MACSSSFLLHREVPRPPTRLHFFGKKRFRVATPTPCVRFWPSVFVAWLFPTQGFLLVPHKMPMLRCANLSDTRFDRTSQSAKTCHDSRMHQRHPAGAARAKPTQGNDERISSSRHCGVACKRRVTRTVQTCCTQVGLSL